MTRKLVLSLIVLAGFTTLAFGSLDAETLEDIVDELE
jgi:hypothetical protein